MIEIATLEGPLDSARLAWVADLYGHADPKFLRTDVLEHLYTRSPAGGGLHAFALDGDRPVGHCSVVPMRARLGTEPLRSGKLEALFLEEPYRGQRIAGRPVVRELLDQLYAFADNRAIDVVHAYATPRIGRIIDFDALERVGESSFVAAATPLRRSERALAAAQRIPRAAASVLARGNATLRAATRGDVDLAEADPPPAGRWTSLAEDAWDWYCGSPLVRVLELGQSRALVQIPGKPREPLRLIGWRAARPGLRPAVQLLSALVGLAQREHASTLRFQPWSSAVADGDLRRACRVLGFVTRPDSTTLWVRARDPALARRDAVVSTPLFSLGF